MKLSQLVIKQSSKQPSYAASMYDGKEEEKRKEGRKMIIQWQSFLPPYQPEPLPALPSCFLMALLLPWAWNPLV
jgi:hypothetical protein